jgi:hypothetical protein
MSRYEFGRRTVGEDAVTMRDLLSLKDITLVLVRGSEGEFSFDPLLIPGRRRMKQQGFGASLAARMAPHHLQLPRGFSLRNFPIRSPKADLTIGGRRIFHSGCCSISGNAL